GGVVIVLDQFFADEDGVFEVVTAPGKERDQNVASESQFTTLSARTVGQNLGLLHTIAYTNERLLADASVLIRTLEFNQLVDVRAHFAAKHAGMVGLDTHDDALGVDLIDDTFAAAEHHCSGVAGGNAFHASADERRFAANQRHSLALHVGTHERAVGVVVLEERDQAGGYRDELFWRNVDIIDFLAALPHEDS